MAALGRHCYAWAFSSFSEWRLLSSCTWASVPEHGLYGMPASVVEALWLICPLACGIFLDQKLNPSSPAFTGRFLTPGPPGKSTVSQSVSLVAQSCPTLCDPMDCLGEAHQASLSITNSWSLLKLMCIKYVMPYSYHIFCRPLLLLLSIFPSIRVFSNESFLCIRWPKYWSFSFSISPSNEYSGLISFRMDWLDLLAVQGKSWGMLILDNYLGVDYIGTGSNKTEL